MTLFQGRSHLKSATRIGTWTLTFPFIYIVYNYINPYIYYIKIYFNINMFILYINICYIYIYIYIYNDLNEAISHSIIHHFPDDTIILLSHKSLKKINKYISHDLCELVQWLRGNKISLNEVR